MGGEWETVDLGSVTDLLTGFPFKSSQYVDNPNAIRLLRGDNIAQGVLRWDGVKRWPHDAVEDASPYKLEEGDVVLAMDRPWIDAGLKYAAIRQSDLPALLVQRVARLRGKECLETSFLKYVISGSSFTDYVLSVQTGTAVPHISGGQIRGYEFALPPLSEQRAIAHILGTLDDKIELNRRMAATLEAMARALFKSWFVDFDPVRAKQEGRDPGLAPHLATLFPDRLVETEHGEVPAGWLSVGLPEIFEINPTRAIKKDLPAPYLDMANMPTTGHAPDEVVQRPFGSGMRFTNGDTLVARITPCLENGKTAFVDFLRDGQIGWGSTEYIVLRPKAPWPEEAGYLLARDQRFRDFAIQGMTGTSGRQRVPASAFDHFRFVSPPREMLLALGSAVKPWFARSSAAVRESRTLAALRDTLLPKLVSGEIRVKDAGEVLERAT